MAAHQIPVVPLNLPPHIRVYQVPATRAVQDAVWTHVKTHFLECADADNPYATSFDDMDIDSLTELMALTLIAIDAFTYTPVAANGPVPMPVGFRGRIKVVIAMTNDM